MSFQLRRYQSRLNRAGSLSGEEPGYDDISRARDLGGVSRWTAPWHCAGNS